MTCARSWASPTASFASIKDASSRTVLRRRYSRIPGSSALIWARGPGVLTVEGLHCRYGRVAAVRDLSIAVHRGEWRRQNHDPQGHLWTSVSGCRKDLLRGRERDRMLVPPHAFARRRSLPRRTAGVSVHVGT